ncbi:amino acid adenylation domain-containing protein [Gordonia sp. NPDC003424]
MSRYGSDSLRLLEAARSAEGSLDSLHSDASARSAELGVLPGVDVESVRAMKGRVPSRAGAKSVGLARDEGAGSRGRAYGSIQDFPFSEAQKSLWLMQEAIPELPLNIAQYTELDGYIDPDAFVRFGSEAVSNAQFMQVRYERDGENVVGIYDPALHNTPDYFDLRSEPDPRSAAEALMLEDYSRPLNPLTDRTVVGFLMRIEDEKFILYNRGHHLVADGLSAKDHMIAGLDAYSAGIAGQPVAPSEPVDFALPARADAGYRTSNRFQIDRSYWRETLADMPAPASLAYRSGTPAAVSRRISAAVPAATMQSLTEAAEQNSTTLPALIATALSGYISRISGSDDVIINFPVAARTTAALRRTPLPVSNVVPLRTHVGPLVTVSEALRGTQSALMGALRHQRYRYADIRNDLEDATSVNPLGSRGLNGPVLNLMLFDREFRCGEATATFHVLTTGPVDDLSVNIYPSAGSGNPGLVLDIEANPNRYDDAEVAEHHRQLLAMLHTFADALLSRPESLIDELPLVVSQGAQSLIAPRPATLPELLDQAVARHSNALGLDGAATGEDVGLTFGELDSRATELASRLRGMGARPGTVVAIMVGRGGGQMVAWWAVARTGATILLIDPAQPSARIARILATAEPVVTISRDGADLGGSILTLEELSRREPAVLDHERPHLDEAAYLVFTSGTTGEPKGVPVPHRGLSTLVEALRGPFGGNDSGGRLIGLASPMFDAVHTELLACATLGLCMVPAPGPTPQLGDLLVSAGITHMMATPSIIATIPDAQLPERVISTGEALPPALAARLTAARTAYNLYGPAEFTLYAVTATLDPGTSWDRPVPIGYANVGVAIHVLDHRLRPVPPGVIGEIYLSGPQTARGYLGQTGSTAAHFVANPWGDGQRMYRTGDLGRIDPTAGALHYHGRNDHQFSIRGVRVEPAEIERASTEINGVAEVVAVLADTTHGPVIDLGVTTDDNADRARIPHILRRHLTAALPPVMWPRRIVVLDAMPLGDTGKLDRIAARTEIENTPDEPTAYVAPQDDLERVIADVVGEVLGIEDPSMAAGLLELGATSMSLLHIAAQLSSGENVEIRIGDLAVAASVAELADVVRSGRPAPAARETPPRTCFRPSRAQREIWLLNRVEPTSPVYHLPVRLTLAAGITAENVRAALLDVAIRHEVLRKVFAADTDGEPVGRVLDVDRVAEKLPVSVGRLDEPGVRAAVDAPFDLTTAPPWRAVIDETLRDARSASASRAPQEPGGLKMVLVGHHVALDAWSMPLLLADFATAVRARQAGVEPQWASPADSYGGHTAEDSDTAAAEEYWAGALDGAPEHLALPEPAVPAQTGLTAGTATYMERTIDASVCRAATDRATTAGTTLHSVLHVALAATLAQFSGTDDTVVAVPIAGRSSTDTLTQVGMFVQTVPLRLRGVCDHTLAESLVASADTLAGAVRHADAAPASLPDVILAYESEDPQLVDTEVVVSSEPLRTGVARTALEFTVAPDGANGLHVTATVAEHHIDVQGATQILETFVAAVAGLADADPESMVRECLPAVDPPQAVARQTPRIDPISALRRSAVENPNAPAILDGSGTVTYAELLTHAEEVATRLAAVGVQCGDAVALRLRRSADTLVAMVAVLMADAAYVPIDPIYPKARIDTILHDVRPVVIVSDGGGPDDARPAEGTASGGAERAARPVSRLNISPYPQHQARPERDTDLAYVIHTSGSTGTPKGVRVTRTNLAAMLGAALDVVGARDTDVWSWAHSYAFDFSVWEIFGALASGGSIAVMDTATVRDPAEFVTAVERHGVTILSQTPTSFSRFIDPEVRRHIRGTESATAAPSLRCVVFGGEALDPASLRSWAHRNPGVRLINMYGITETTVHLTWSDVDVDDERSIIGVPLDGVGLHVLDQRGWPVPVGGRGELWVSGTQVASGYLRSAELTAERFVAQPDGTRRYRTGDIVRRIDGERLAYLGRSDDQVQIRGHRVDPAEVVAALHDVDGVSDVRVVIQPGAQRGDERLVAFVLAGDHAGEAHLLAECAARLPAHAVPSRIGVVTRWPMTDTGKLDRASLLASLGQVSSSARPLTAPEEIVAAAMHTVLGDGTLDLLGPHTSFFAAGGSSLSAARLAARLSSGEQQVSVADIFDNPTVEGIARLLQATSSGDPVPALDAHEVLPQHLPLTPEQEDLWLRWRADPEFTGYLLPVAVPLGDVDPGRVRRVLEVMVRRHDVLRTSFPEREGVPYQWWWDDAALGRELAMVLRGGVSTTPPRLAPRGLLNQRGDGADTSGLDRRVRQLCRPIDLTESLPWRAELVEQDGGLWLLGAIHHIAVDGEALDILAAEFHELLTTEGHPSGRPPIDYRDYTLWRQTVLEQRRPQLVEYWSTVFDTPPEPLHLPEMNFAAALGSNDGQTAHEVTAVLTAAETTALDALAGECRTTPYILLHTVIAAVLTRTSGADSITIGAAVTGRLDDRLADVPGLFARTIPLHTRIDLDLPFRRLLTDVTVQDLAAIAHADLPLAEIAALADPAHTGIGHALFDVMFASVNPAVMDPLDGRPKPPPLFGIDIQEFRSDIRQHLTMTCRAAVAAAPTLTALLNRTIETLRAVLAAPDAPTITHLTPTLPTLAPPTPSTVMLADLLTAHMSTAPTATAIIDAAQHFPGLGDTITNADLDRLTTALARRLVAMGIGPGDVVALHLPRSIHSVVATIAVARAGAAFVHVEPTDPASRRHMLIARSRARCLLTTSEHDFPHSDSEIDVLFADDLTADAGPSFDSAERRRPLHLDDLAYLTFTSGTTGTPKAVEITHRGLADWAHATASRLGLTATDRMLHTYAPTFDAYLMGIVPVRVAGATIVICPPDVVADNELGDTLERMQVNVLLTTPSVLATLNPHAPTSLRHIVVGGEALPPNLVRDWPIPITNEYGPTETTVAATSATLVAGGPVTIGTPLPGVGALILDDALRPVPDLTIGELYLTGNGLARGYLDDPARTATAFVACPWQPSHRMYRTGDLVHRRLDGTLVIHGRSDHQLKIRGIRIEPAEINAALTTLPDVAAAATTTRTTAAGEQILASWVVPESGHDIRTDDVRRDVANLLPRSLVPAIVTVVDSIPRTSSGKIDLTALPAPELAAGRGISGPTEEFVAQSCAEMLDVAVDEISADTDIFILGVTSLSASRIAARLSAETGHELPLRELFDARTVAAIATRLDDAPSTTRIVPVHRPLPEHLPLSPAQQRMWIHHRLHPTSSAYHLPIAVRLRGLLDVVRLQHALATVVAAHASLRTVYPDGPSGPAQVVLEAADIPLHTVTIAPQHLADAVYTEVTTPFDLTLEPGIRAHLLTSSSDRHDSVLVVVMHHIAVDGWSTRTLLDDLLNAYAGRDVDPRTDLTYADFSMWQREVLGDAGDPQSRQAEEINYWASALAGASPVRFPGVDDGRGVDARSGRITRTLDSQVTAEVTRVTATRSATLFHAVHAALAETLSHLSGDSDITVGVPVRGRPDPAWDDVVGMFVNTVAVRTHVDFGAPIVDAISDSRNGMLVADAHSLVPYDDVVRALFPASRTAAGEDPLISVLLVSQDVVPSLGGDFEIDGGVRAEIVGYVADAIAAKYDLEVVVAQEAEGTTIGVVHSGRVSRATAGLVLDGVLGYLEGVAGGLDRPGLAALARAARPAGGGAGAEGVESAGLDTPGLAALARAARPAVGRAGAEGVESAGLDTPGLAALARAARPAEGARGLDARGSFVAGLTRPASEASARPAGEAHVGAVSAAFATALNLPPESIDDGADFFAFGGTSLSAARVVSALRTATGRQIPAQLLFENPTPDALAAAMAAVTTAAELPALLSFSDSPDELPLAPTQQRIWTSATLFPEEATYMVPLIVPTPGHSVVEAEEAITALVAAQPVLRTRYADSGDGPRQILDHSEPAISHLAVKGITPHIIQTLLTTPFDLASAPPIRFTVITDGPQATAVVMIAHHIAVDGESVSLLQRDLTRFLEREVVAPQSITLAFARVTRWLSAVADARRDVDLRYWRQELDGYSGMLDLVGDRPAIDTLTAAHRRITLPDNMTARMDAVVREHHVTDFHLLHAATVLALAAQAGTDDVVVATPVSMRRDPQLAGVVGMLVATVAPRVTFTPQMTVGDLLAAVRSTDLAAQDHAFVPFDDVIAELDLPHTVDTAPLAQVLFSLAPAPVGEYDSFLGGQLPPEPVEFDLQITAAIDEGRWVIDLEYAIELFDDDTITHLAHRIEAAVSAVADDPNSRLGDLTLFDAEEREQLAALAAARFSPSAPTLSGIFDEAVTRHANRLAIDDGHRQITYRDLDSWIAATANRLRERGFGRGDLIALVLPRSVEWVVAMWATTRIAATAVLVDASYPQARIDAILARTGARSIAIADVPPQPAEPVVWQRDLRPHRDDVAYVIMTSGTTGTPNAVEVTHGGVHRLLTADGAAVAADARVALAASTGFDTIIAELLAPLPSGATLVPVPAETTAGDDLAAWLSTAQITVLSSTPSVLATLDPAALPALDLVVAGGESLPQDLADRWATHTTLVNSYGPTEATVEVTFDRHDVGKRVRLGPLLAGDGGSVLDRNLRPVRPGVVGELYLSGSALARGYRDDPALTAARFVAAPDGRRMYRTGDLVRLVGDDLFFVGRADQQIQIRGQRVELGEIDGVLRHAGAVRAATMVRAAPAGESLVAYVVLADDDQSSIGGLKAACRRQLPRHMLPAQIIAVDELPLTPSGKLDTRLLPDVDWSTSQRAPATDTEAQVLAAFQEILGVEIGMDDDFFDAGGNSLALIGLQQAIQRHTGIRVPAASLLLNPSPAAVADRTVNNSATEACWPIEHLIDLSGDDAADRPILWCIHPASGLAVDYRPLATELSDLRVMGVQVAQPESRDDGTLASVAAGHLAAIRQVQPTGPYHLGGWSAGGIIAQEMARQLDDAGQHVATLVLLDVRTPQEIVEVADDETSDVDDVIGEALTDGSVPDGMRSMVAEYRRSIGAVLSSIDRHRPGVTQAERVIAFVADDNPNPDTWRAYVHGEWHAVDVDAHHADFGEPDVMARIGRQIGELW